MANNPMSLGKRASILFLFSYYHGNVSLHIASSSMGGEIVDYCTVAPRQATCHALLRAASTAAAAESTAVAVALSIRYFICSVLATPSPRLM